MGKHDSYALYLKHKALKKWKAEAMPLLTHAFEIADTVPGDLGSYKIENIAKELQRLRGDLRIFK